MFIPIKAVGKERPRFSTWTKSFYTPKKTKDFENLIGAYTTVYMRKNGLKTTTGPVAITLIVKDKIPSNWTKKKTLQASCGEIRPMKTPDGDNILKAVLDGMNGILYADDRQVVQFFFNRLYAYEDSIEIDVKYL